MSRETERPEVPASSAVRTYRYLRLAMIAMVVLLFSSVVFEWSAAPDHCWQSSISAYWHTPVRSVFVGVLVTMGACLIALKGNNKSEDVLLNLAGILAPGVAFIPTPSFEAMCSSVPAAGDDFSGAIANNMKSLFVVGVVAVITAYVIARRSGAKSSDLQRWDRLGLIVGAAATVGGAVWFFVARDNFVANGHNVAAITMFAAIVAVVWVNARDVKASIDERPSIAESRAKYVPLYRTIAIAMAAAIITAVGFGLSGSTHVVIWVEVVLIILFAVFWIAQTRELWHQGLRDPEAVEPATR